MSGRYILLVEDLGDAVIGQVDAAWLVGGDQWMANAPAVLGDPEDRRGVRHHGNRRAFRQRPWAFQNDHAANDFACEDHVEIIHRNLIVFKAGATGATAQQSNGPTAP